MATPLNEATVSGLAAGPSSNGQKAVVVAKPEDLRNHRLIVMFFDLTSMQPEDLDRSVEAAQAFLKTKMQPADLVALVSLGRHAEGRSGFYRRQGRADQRSGVYNGTEGEGFAQGATANSNQVEDTTGYTPDESEYNDLNTDRELFALRAVAQSLSKIDEKKSLLYFSGGISRDGIENQASLRAAINAAVRANLAIYSVDTRGLQAIGPAGRCIDGEPARQRRLQRRRAQQQHERQLRQPGSDGDALERHRRQGVLRLQRFCAGVCAGAEGHFGLLRHRLSFDESGARRKVSQADGEGQAAGREARIPAGLLCAGGLSSTPARRIASRNLTDQLASDLPATDMAVYLDAMYFRLDENRYYVPVSLLVPGSQIPFVKGGDKDKATLDIIGEVIDEVKRPIGHARETVKLNLDPSLKARQKNIQYTTSFNLPPGKYQIKFVVRENQTGRMGSFLADVTLPDMKKAPLKMSSIVLASARQPSKKAGYRSAGAQRPGVRAQHRHVFRQDQHMYLLYEVYDPAREKAAENAPKGTKPGINLLSSLELIQGSTKVYETPLVQAKAINVEGRDAVAVEMDVPLAGLKPGAYLCQLNVIDDAGGSFAFPRFAVLVREPAAVPVVTSGGGPAE